MSAPWTLRAGSPLRGSLDLPGDKSLSHRAFLLNCLARGSARVEGCNDGADVESTRRVLTALGVRLHRDAAAWRVEGRAKRLRPATDLLDCGNSGTTLRLLAGILAAQPFSSTLDGDASLRRRPMARIAEPLRTLGARVEGPDNGATPPLIVTGGRLRGARLELPVASAQVKSCLLLAAATADVTLELTEPGASRDHTERLLAAMGAPLRWGSGWVRLGAPSPLQAVDLAVPGDPSAAALVGVAALAVPDSRVRLESLLLNPTRIAFAEVLRRMRARVDWQVEEDRAGEPVGWMELAASGELEATEIQPSEVPALLDEIPALAVAAALARGTTRMRGLAELRVKESDRLSELQTLLRAHGVESSVTGDSLEIIGGRPRAVATVPPSKDHRLVMAGVALALAGLHRRQPTEPHSTEVDIGPAAVSFPGFRQALEGLRRGG